MRRNRWTPVLALALLTSACLAGKQTWGPASPSSPASANRSASFWGPSAAEWESIRIAARRIDLLPERPEAKAVGGLTYVGGLHLQSTDARFGGLSGLYVDPDGKLLAVTDQAVWFAARLTFGASGELTGLVDGRVAAVRDEAGRTFANKRSGDAEGLARLADGRFAVSFEQNHVVRLYDIHGEGPSTAAKSLLRLAGAERLRDNESLEAIAPLGDDLIVLAERGGARETSPFWRVSPEAREPVAPAGEAAPAPGFGFVALDRLPGGDLIVMQRFYSPLSGPRIVLERVSAAGLEQTPARWETNRIAEISAPMSVDNFEGAAVVPGAGSSARIYLLSDDNFRGVQRTLLLAFDYAPEPEARSIVSQRVVVPASAAGRPPN